MNNQPVSPTANTDPFENKSPNLLLGLIAGGVAMLVGAVIWGAVTYFTKYQIGWMSIGVGFLVGIAIQKFGRGNSILFGIMGAGLALVGCLLGNLFFYGGVIAEMRGVTLFNVFLSMILDPVGTVDLFFAAFEFMDLVFYALAIYAGFRYSFASK
ncbi:MAG: hypothetical protein ACOYZ8_01245 [Chloroflexota bacterium]